MAGIIKTGIVNKRSNAAAALAGLSCVAGLLAGCGAAASTTPPPSTQPGASAQPASTQPGAASASSAAQPHTGPGDVCALITQQEASAALGGDTGPGSPRGTGDNQGCEYTRTGGGFLQAGFNSNVTRSYFDDAKGTVQGASDASATVVEVPGLGDANFVSSSPHGGGCYVFKGSILGHVTLISPTEMTAAADKMSTICRAMGGRL